MTLRIYVRWPDQKVSNKTVTDSDAVADFALAELKQRAEDFRARGAWGIAMSNDGKQVEYVLLNPDAPRR